MYEKCHLVCKHSPLTLSAVVKLGKSAKQRMENIRLQQVKVARTALVSLKTNIL